ncbi:hypothetical protein MUG94_12225 [Arthrobacter gengyunqii]|uniref:Secretion protein HlyD n=1 Tax=Arthrobacter gengyunqii TaxID=2886940 RepID=A0A9X1S439_9MICC|nr:hypothetical protein [Arthrobacter gengyunqii]MCC3267880.1 hypothetical protein [Arthrobacter gengyunqii]UOY95306.1 hypothetical protein MUG94_12225 [Arthrobacter gengyunqii]
MTVRRYVFPTLWLVIFAVMAAALFKLAFLDGLQADAAAGYDQPSARISTPLVPAVLGTVTNLVSVPGSVVSDPAVTVKSTSEGTVDFIYVEAGEAVTAGTPLFQVKTLLEPEPQAAPVAPADDDEPAAPPVAVSPAYTYADVVAASDGTVTELSVLLKQQVSVGTDVASIDPGTFSVSGTLTSDQQFRIFSRANTAMVTVNGGPAPFPCSDVTMGKTPAVQAGVSTQAQAVGPAAPPAEAPAAGSVSCAVPGDTAVFAGLGATIDISAGQAENVITVPTTAVRGSVQTGVVWVMPNGADGQAGEAAGAMPGAAGAETAGGPQSAGGAVEREVALGLNDGQTVEIMSGLAEGEMVLQFVPGAPAAADEGQMNGMPGVMGG